MTYEEFKEELQQIVLTRELVKCGYISYTDECVDGNLMGYHTLRELNPAFGYSTSDFCGVHDMHWSTSENEWSKGMFRFSLTICNHNYKDVRIEECDGCDWNNGRGASFHSDAKRALTDEQRDKIIAYVKKWHARKLAEVAARYEKGKNEISIDDLQKECEKVANEILNGKTNKYGDKLRAKLCVGKRTCDNLSKPYTALCIECYDKGDWHYIAGFVFGKDEFGINQMKYMRPLCGEGTMEFNWDTFKEYVKSEIK